MNGHIRSGRTHCRHGHEYTHANTRWYRGTRMCVTCIQARLQKEKDKRKQKKLATLEAKGQTGP